MQESDPTVILFLDHFGRELVDQFSRDLTSGKGAFMRMGTAAAPFSGRAAECNGAKRPPNDQAHLPL